MSARLRDISYRLTLFDKDVGQVVKSSDTEVGTGQSVDLVYGNVSSVGGNQTGSKEGEVAIRQSSIPSLRLDKTHV
jgi:hypothetical protein